MSADQTARSEDNPAQKKRPSELALRIGAAAVLVPVALLAEWLGSWFFAAFAALCGSLIVHEFLRMTLAKLTMPMLAAAIAVVWLAALTSVGSALAVPLAIVLAGCLIVFALAGAGKPGAMATAGVLYGALPVIALVALRRDDAYGLAAVLFVLCLVWATDTGAYAAGRSIGGAKLAPRISPNKTWAGLFGGMASAALVGAITAWLTAASSMVVLAVLAAALAVVAQAGDLFESSLKRRSGVKDSGTLIPGHGGVMDRLDGIIAAAVVAGMIGYLRGGEFGASRGLLVW